MGIPVPGEMAFYTKIGPWNDVSLAVAVLGNVNKTYEWEYGQCGNKR